MNGKLVGCKDIGNYEGLLTRGQTYEVLEENLEKQQIRIWTDLNNKRWFPLYCFECEGKPIPILIDWTFDSRSGFGDEYSRCGRATLVRLSPSITRSFQCRT